MGNSAYTCDVTESVSTVGYTALWIGFGAYKTAVFAPLSACSAMAGCMQAMPSLRSSRPSSTLALSHHASAHTFGRVFGNGERGGSTPYSFQHRSRAVLCESGDGAAARSWTVHCSQSGCAWHLDCHPAALRRHRSLDASNGAAAPSRGAALRGMMQRPRSPLGRASSAPNNC